MRLLPRCLSAFLLVCCLPAAHGQDLRTGVPLDDGTFLAAGDCLARIGEDGNILRLRPLDRTLTALASDGEHLYALDGDGLHLLEMDTEGTVLSEVKLPAKGRLRGLAAGQDGLWAVTDAGEILHGSPAAGWTVTDFNALYAGYYPEMTFRAVATGGGAVMIAGQRPDGAPAAFTSARGTVWSERLLDYAEDGLPCAFVAEVTSLSYDAPQDRFYLLGSGGAQLALPACSHCNAISRYPADTLYARIPAGRGALILGSDGFRRLEER